MTAPDDDRPILFFDGVCGLCNRVVDFCLRNDRRGRILFAPLQGETAAAKLPADDTASISTVVFLDGGRVSRRSTAVVRLLRHMGGIWVPLSWLLWLIPWPLRDPGYRLVARLRYRLFGRHDTCRLPTPADRARVLP